MQGRKADFRALLYDFRDSTNRVWCGNMKIVGYIEAKSLRTNLDEAEKTEQICRYTATFPNFVLTNFIEFRLYKTGKCASKARISEFKNIYGLRESIPIESEKEFEDLMEKFFSFSYPNITNTNLLAIELAKRTRFLRDQVVSQQIEDESGIKVILGFYDAF
jgi:hypothetical protein